MKILLVSTSHIKWLNWTEFSGNLGLCFDAIIGLLNCKLSMRCIVHVDYGVVAFGSSDAGTYNNRIALQEDEEEEEDDDDEED